MDMKTIESGSSGNCSYVFYKDENTLILFDLGISFKKLNSYLLEHENIALDRDKLNVSILVTHGHSDHWLVSTFNSLCKWDNLDIKIAIPKGDEVTFTNFNHTISAKKFVHGDTFTRFYILDESYGYLTDCNKDELPKIVLWKKAYNLKELLIEANYDEYYLDNTARLSLVQGYNVTNGFERHLSKQDAEFIIFMIHPQTYKTIHHSKRFFEVNND